MSLQDCAPPPGRGSSPSARGRWPEEAEVATDRTLRSGEREGNPAVRGDMDGARGQYAEMSRTEEDEGRVTHL